MDHNLGDSLNLEGEIGVDFEPSDDVVVSQADITLDGTVTDSSMQMEFENIQEQQMLIDSGNEEIIDFIDDQFGLQEYSVQDEQMTVAEQEEQVNNLLTSQSESMMDVQFEPQIVVSSASLVQNSQVFSHMPKFIAVKAATQTKTDVPRPVAIAPKPAKQVVIKQYSSPKPIAPKPVCLVANKCVQNTLKKVSLSSVLQGNTGKGNTVLAQIGKNLVMVPAGAQKIKLVAPGSIPGVQYISAADSDQTQLMAKTSQAAKPVVMKFVTAQTSGDSSNQSAVLTKLLPSGSTQTRFVTLQPKTVPISMSNKVVISSPTKQQAMKVKKQIITIKSPSKMTPIQTQQGTTKKVVIKAANPKQNVILKTTAPTKTIHMTKDGTIINPQKTQLHQINVPGKGVQYIKLVTNPAQANVAAKPAAKPQATKTFVLADGKGNLIQMSADKLTTAQPPPLVVRRNNTINKLTGKPQQKLVRIAPIGAKVQHQVFQQKSLLAPASPQDMPAAEEYDEADFGIDSARVKEEVDSKAALRALIEDAVADSQVQEELDIEYDPPVQNTSQENSINMDQNESSQASGEHPLIVIPSHYKDNSMISNEYSEHEESKRSMVSVDVERDFFNYQSPRSPHELSETDMVSQELGLRPRKACNCTKSQCLKLYCDCFANGEFCNNCNCNNCHNNLENEELRQKAIRGCLDRNPNAFRPKIGKSKSGGPEIVRRHNKGCNCKRSGCLKNYCECYEAKIACSKICKCVGCRNVEDSVERTRRDPARGKLPPAQLKQPCSFMTSEVIEAVCQCLLAAAGEPRADPLGDVIEEFARCLQDIIGAAHHAEPRGLCDDV